YVTRLRCWEGSGPYARATVLPVPTLSLLVNFGDAFPIYKPVYQPPTRAGAAAEGGRGPSIRQDIGPRMTCGASYALGVWDTAPIMAGPRPAQIGGAPFRPGGAAPFLLLPLGELRNQLVPLDAIWGRAAAEELRERLAAASTPQERLALFERLLLGQLAR